jgi:ADP-ribosylglycohydrolase
MQPRNSLAGALLGTALGDAIGLVAEGMKPAAIARRFGRLDRFRLLPGVGVVSDDTEQAALVAQSLAREPGDAARCARAFRRSLAGWFLRLPWGLGLATLRACCRILAGLETSGVVSAGNGSTMRAPVVGVFFASDPARRQDFGEALARVTHLDPRAIEGARFAAELAAACATASPTAPRGPLVTGALAVVHAADLRSAIEQGLRLGAAGAEPSEAARQLGNTGFVVPTLAVAAYAFVKDGHDPLEAIVTAIAVGGDADTIAAIVGAWVGALHGADALPAPLVARLAPGPFGERHLRALARDLARSQEGPSSAPEARYSPLVALLRNLALFPIVLVQGVRTLLP